MTVSAYFRPALACLALAVASPALALAQDAPPASAAQWRETATEADRVRLRGWRRAWMEGLAQARGSDGGAIAAEPALYDPDRVLDDALPPAGEYRCRTIKLGAKGNATAMAGYTAYGWFACRIEGDGDTRRFVKTTGSQRPVGTLYRDTTTRGIFLGTLAVGDETMALRYSQDRMRDMIGIVERIGTSRWRLVFPTPHFESLVDVMELVPAT